MVFIMFDRVCYKITINIKIGVFVDYIYNKLLNFLIKKQ